ncbi:MAG: ATP synthase F1 subunit delta [Oscillospiraceae bacterium]|nr:ATP synthase F1 subunit delta [Oscillospiraceae bacterium]
MEKLSALYASALFELAVQRGLTDEFLSQSVFIHDSLQDDECRQVLVHPHIPAQKKQELFSKVFGKYVNKDLLGFMNLVAEKNREEFLLPALTELIEMIERHKGKIKSTVYFASTISESQLAEMKTTLSKKLNKIIDISLKVDPSLIGGPYIFIDGYYIDWTVKTRLRDLIIHMKEGCGA